MRLFKNHSRTKGQALVEFAIVAVGLLMLIFLIIEAARILWAWNTVQNAARAGARYATTGNYDIDCSTQDIPKYAAICSDLDLYRSASVIDEAHRNLSGLPLNEAVNSNFEDMDYYSIEIYGVDQLGQLKGTNLPDPYGPAPFAGSPNKPVIVRVIYRVPIITPFFSPILPSIPVFGQTTLYNEPFGQLGGTGQSAGAPPPIPALPTAGVTPSFTPTPTPGASDTPTSTATATATATTQSCPVRWTSSLVRDIGLASVTGLYDKGNGGLYRVDFYNLTDDPGETAVIGAATMVIATGGTHACPGIGNATLPLTADDVGDTIRARHEDGSYADIIVQALPDTATPTPTNTAIPTEGTPPSPTPEDTPTPSGPFISVLPRTCAMPPSTTIYLNGANWDSDNTITIYIDGRLRESIAPSQHNGTFQRDWVQPVENGNTYQILVVDSDGNYDTHSIVVPCPNITATPVLATATNTPAPADLTIGQPILISTPPIIEYEPVQFQVPITNVGSVDVNSQFFIDIFIDPDPVPVVPGTESIPIPENPAYSAVGSLPGGSSKVITITSEIGFTGGATDRDVYSMVDSLEDITEELETNNISQLLEVQVTPANTPLPTPTPNGSETIAGKVRFLISKWVPQQRVRVYLTNNVTGEVIANTITDELGHFSFDGIAAIVPEGYKITACFPIDNGVQTGNIPLVNPPNNFASIFMTSNEAECPVSR